MAEVVKRELELRDNGEFGVLSNLSDKEVLALAYKLGLIK